jgi:hypothetical protein
MLASDCAKTRLHLNEHELVVAVSQAFKQIQENEYEHEVRCKGASVYGGNDPCFQCRFCKCAGE